MDLTNNKLLETELIINKDGSIYHLGLIPDQISDTIITVGDPNRVKMVSDFFDCIYFKKNNREFVTHVGKYGDKNITVISTGMGTDNIEILMVELDILANLNFSTRQFKSKRKKLKIVRIGTSGAIQKNIPIGTHLLSRSAVGLDTLMNFYYCQQSDLENKISKSFQHHIQLPCIPYTIVISDELEKKFNNEMMRGNTLTCPGFYAPQGRKLYANVVNNQLFDMFNSYDFDEFQLTNIDMETAGYYAMGRLLGHEVISTNAIIANRLTQIFSKQPSEIIKKLIVKVLDQI